MTLFDDHDKAINLLPYEGDVRYYGQILLASEADEYFKNLFRTIEWRNDEAVIFGKRMVTKRKVAWYGDRDFGYSYSNTHKTALPWTVELLQLKELVEMQSGETYNSCLLNLYHTGEEGMAWHSDGEKDLKKHGAIASLSLGAARKFAFKHKQSKKVIAMQLMLGSLLVMKGVTQDHWQHRLPPTTKVKEPRINLTFRTIEEPK